MGYKIAAQYQEGSKMRAMPKNRISAIALAVLVLSPACQAQSWMGGLGCMGGSLKDIVAQFQGADIKNEVRERQYEREMERLKEQRRIDRLQTQQEPRRPERAHAARQM
jgi:capsule polysaccharide export protein KpsE/RkpR